MADRDEFEILSKKEINSLNKDDLQKYAVRVSIAYKGMYNTLFSNENGIIPKLERQLAVALNSTNTFVNEEIDTTGKSKLWQCTVCEERIH